MLNGQKRSKPGWVWAIAIAATFSLTGCGLGLYPTKAGQWPHGVWGDVLQFVSHVIDFFAHYVGYGLAVIIVTILVRLLILPLMIRQIKFSKTMQQLQPQIKEIRSRHKGDNQKIQQETMKLYQEAGFNPMAGCLPMIVQLPVLYALFGAIEGNLKLSQATFLGIFQLGHQDHTFILPILAGVTTYFSSKVMMTGNDSQQKTMLFIMPVFVFFMATRFASGLSLYWVVSNLFTAVQTYFIRVRPSQAQAALAGGGKVGTKIPAKAAVKSGASGAKSSGRPANSAKSGKPVKSAASAKPDGAAKTGQKTKSKANPKQAPAKQNNTSEATANPAPSESDSSNSPSSNHTSGLTDSQPTE